ncbi:MAG TPA: tetratricopeptide repeat protein [Methylomirabilota bacterium]
MLRQTSPPGVRAAALLLSGDAAYGLRAYTRASERYREFLSMYDLAVEAPQAMLALGWAEFRLGRVEQARRTWTQLASHYPMDDRAPLGLLLAAEAAIGTGDPAAARAQLDQVLSDYEAGPVVEVARLSRAVLAARQSREDDAVRDLRELVRGQRVCAAGARRALLRIMTEPGHEEPLVRVSHAGCVREASAAVPIERFAAPLLDGAGDPDTTPLVLGGLVGLAADDGRWTEAATLSSRLVEGYQAYPGTEAVVARVAARAASGQQWPVARDLYGQLLARYRDESLDRKARLDFAESLLRTGAPDAAQAELARLVDGGGDREQAPRALYLLASALEAQGRPQEALALQERLARDYPGTEWAAEGMLPRARLLQSLGRAREARPLLETVVQGTDGEPFAEAAYRLGQISRDSGERSAAVSWYLTAASTGSATTWTPRALAGAVESLAGGGDRAFAEAVFRRLQASDEVDPELLANARKAIQAVRDRTNRRR